MQVKITISLWKKLTSYLTWNTKYFGPRRWLPDKGWAKYFIDGTDAWVVETKNGIFHVDVKHIKISQSR